MNIQSFIATLKLAGYSDKITIYDDKRVEVAYEGHIYKPIPDGYNDMTVEYMWVGTDNICLVVHMIRIMQIRNLGE